MIESTVHTESMLHKIRDESDRFRALQTEVSKIIIGQEEIITSIAIAILSNGHILLEGVPGVAKTSIIKAITRVLGLTYSRIQFTPDLLPADLIGTLIFNQKINDFETKKGPIFANIILADEINRAPAKVQSALLEAMQEHQVTIGSTTFKLEEPFFVFATQNPLEQEGTYRLPEAQVDRFMFKLLIDYPTIEQEREIVRRKNNSNDLSCVLIKDDIFFAQQLVKDTYMDEKIVDYIVNIVFATRKPSLFGLSHIEKFIRYGVSPRATLALCQASKAYAFLKRRHFVTPDDIKAVCPAILRHRITLTYQAQAEEITSDELIRVILGAVPSP